MTRKPDDSFFIAWVFLFSDIIEKFIRESVFLENTDLYRKIHNSDTVSLYIRYNEKKGDVPYVRE